MSCFLFSGEGVHSAQTDISVLKTCSSWNTVMQAIKSLGHAGPDAWLQDNLGNHSAPSSPVVTVAIGMLNADLWRQWGVEPSMVLGHSVGEVAAAYVAGLMSAEEAIKLAHDLGSCIEGLPGAMMHTEMLRKDLSEVDPALSLASINYVIQRGAQASEDLLSVTLCGPESAVDLCMQKRAGSIKLRPKHPWHHNKATYKRSVDAEHKGVERNCTFISGSMGKVMTGKLPVSYWSDWACKTMNFADALEAAAAQVQGKCAVVEMGAHCTVLEGACRTTFGVERLACYAGSMRRGDAAASFVRSQRAMLPGFKMGLETIVKKTEDLTLALPRGSHRVDYKETFASQGIASQNLVALTPMLAKYFPGIAAHDLYRYNSLEVLVNSWDGDASLLQQSHIVSSSSATALEVVGCAVRLPAGIDSPGAFWAFLEDDDTSAAFSNVPEGHPAAAFLNPRFDAATAKEVAKAAGCGAAEAVSTDIQHALALRLAEEMWRDAGEEVAKAAKSAPHRVGVYIGAWQAATPPDRPPSAYGVVGSSLSILAARIANTYNLQGPAMTVNTACSSSLVAVDLALRDAKAGRIDFAIVGGINLFGADLRIFEELRQAGMLSPTARCHALSAKADGYVRGEGGILFLLHASGTDPSSRSFPSHARILGSGLTQNSAQSPITAVDPTAQERAISMACADAGITPQALAAVELHGTGTSLGDPVEISALARAVGNKDSKHCVVTAAKMHVGHLESAAGAVGLLKAIMMCEKNKVPGFEVRGGLNPEVSKAMQGASLAPVGKPAILQEDAYVGVSSFGFGGSNAHVVVTPTPKQRSLPAYGVPLQYHKVLWQLCAPAPAKDEPLDFSSFVVLGAGSIAIELGKIMNTTPVKELSAVPSGKKHVIFVIAGEEIREEANTLMRNLLLASQQAMTWASTFWVVSQGAWSVEGDKDLKLVSNPAQTAAWGFSRVLRTEAEGHLRCFLVDVCPLATSQQAASSLLAELKRSSPDEEVALRGEQRFVPRLNHLSIPQRPCSSLTYAKSESALITGGLGGLGLLLAEFLLRHCGLGEVILTSRSAPKPEVSQRLKRLEAETDGIVRTEAVDVSKEDQVRSLLGKAQDSGKTLVAIYHLAGVLENHTIAELTPDIMRNVMAAKTGGATYLDRHARALCLRLKHFVLFSSIFALLPFKKNSHYAAGNLFLDGLAQFRRGLGFHALAINWGAWAGAGMAHNFGQGWASYWEDLGMKFCEPDQGLAAMATLIAHGETNAGVFGVDWKRYAAAGLRPATQLMTTLCPELAAEAAASASADTAKLAQQEVSASRSNLGKSDVAKVILAEVAELLDCKTTDVSMEDSFIDAGVDSLMLAQLRTRLQDRLNVKLDGTALMQNPSVATLAAYINPLVLPQAVQQLPPSPSSTDCHGQLVKGANVVETIISEVAELLDCRSIEIDVEDSFIDAGVDSIMMAQLRTRLRDKLGVDLDGTALMSHPSVKKLAAHIGQVAQSQPPAEPAERRPSKSDSPAPNPALSGDLFANQTFVVKTILGEVAELLDCTSADLDKDANFVDAGLDSIMLSQLRTRLQDRLGVVLDGTALMQHPSIAALAAHIVPPDAQPSAIAKQSARVASCGPSMLSTNVIHEDVMIPNGVRLGDFVTIGKGAIIGPDVTVASNVVIGEGAEIGARSHLGPFCILGTSVKVGSNTAMLSHCHIEGLVVLGNGNKLAAFCHFRGFGYTTKIGNNNNFSSHVTVGLDPENYSARPPPTGGIEIGNDNSFRESSNVHGPEGKRGGELDGTTRIGNKCYFMNMAHIAHDNIIEDQVTLAPSVMLGGYTRIMYRANVGIGSSVHQYSTIGPFCMVGQHTSLTCDALPYTLVTNRGANGRAASNMLNVVGLTRSGRATDEEVVELERFYKNSYNPRKPWLKDQIPTPAWFSEDMAKFDHHRKCQEKQRSVTPITF